MTKSLIKNFPIKIPSKNSILKSSSSRPSTKLTYASNFLFSKKPYLKGKPQFILRAINIEFIPTKMKKQKGSIYIKSLS